MTSKLPFGDFDLTKFLDPSKLMDASKFTDMTKMLTEFRVPGVDLEPILATQRKNIEALTAANQLAIEGIQAVFRRQGEILRQTVEEAQGIISELMSAGTPEDKIARQADLLKAAFEKALANMKEMAEMVAKSNSEAADVLTVRVKESIEELKSTVAAVVQKK
jgi:phasin family protein